jgi:hypothetical protein
MPEPKQREPNRYEAIILRVFEDRYRAGATEIEFTKEDLISTAKKLNIKEPSNIGDILYTFRYRKALPQIIRDTVSEGMEWIIKGNDRSNYRFKQVLLNRIIPRDDLITIKIPDATPEIITAYALGDEQALLAKVRYNRLIDIFLGITAFSLQNHLRTTVKTIGQIEIDEIYVGIDRYGRQFIVPVQAKGGNDKHAVVQTMQDITCCTEKFPNLNCRAVSAQFMSEGRIAMFELTIQDDEVKVIEEKHYQLVSSGEISLEDLRNYGLWNRSDV